VGEVEVVDCESSRRARIDLEPNQTVVFVASEKFEMEETLSQFEFSNQVETNFNEIRVNIANSVRPENSMTSFGAFQKGSKVFL